MTSHARSVDYADLPSPAQVVLPAAYFPNPSDETTSAPASVPSDYLVQEPKAAAMSSVTPVSLEQGKASGQISVHGANLAQLTPGAFSVDGGGVSVTGGTVTDSLTSLTVNVDPHAALGQRGMHVGSFAFSTAPITITAQPRAESCDTVLLTQAMTAVTQTIIVTGQVLTNAQVSLSGSPEVTITSTTSDTRITITATIAASHYSPYEPPDDGGPVQKPIPYRAPPHVAVRLALTVAPVGGPSTSFPITLDAIE